MTTVLELEQIKPLVDPAQLIEEIEAGFVLYSDGKVTVPPVGFLHFDDPPGDVHIKYGFVVGGDYHVLKMASGSVGCAHAHLTPRDGLAGWGWFAKLTEEVGNDVSFTCNRD